HTVSGAVPDIETVAGVHADDFGVERSGRNARRWARVCRPRVHKGRRQRRDGGHQTGPTSTPSHSLVPLRGADWIESGLSEEAAQVDDRAGPRFWFGRYRAQGVAAHGTAEDLAFIEGSR